MTSRPGPFNLLSLVTFLLAVGVGYWSSFTTAESPTPVVEESEPMTFACGNIVPGGPPRTVTLPPAPPPPVIEEFVHITEEMPLFPGCEMVSNYQERKQCADKRLIEFIYRNIKYPPSARDISIEGYAVVSFVVEKDGRITDAKVVRDPGAGLGAEALRVVELMNERGLRWETGRQAGRPVRVHFNLPVRFRLE